MRRAAVVCAWIIGVGGCWDREAAPSGDPVRLGQVGFDMPAGWHRTDANHPGAQVSIWVPETEGNPRKESVTVIVTSSTEDSLDEARLEKLLAGSQVALRGAKTSKVMPVTTQSGLAGFRVEVEFLPQAMTVRYRRTHVVLRDGNKLVHVMYTARDPELSRETLDLVLSTVRHEEAAS